MSLPPKLPKQDFTTIDNLHVDGVVEGTGFDKFALRTETMMAGEAINGHRFVSATGNGIVLAGPKHPHVVGIILAAVSAGESATVFVSGKITHPGWTFREGEIFLGPNGVPTQTLPTDFPVHVTVGKMVSVTTMLLGVESPIFNP